jgi:hypothetical protein
MMKELEKVLLPGMFVFGLQVRVWASPCLLSAFLSASEKLFGNQPGIRVINSV